MWIYIVVFFATFFFMEFMAWFSHKYIMHGFLWVLHADHHKKDHDSWLWDFSFCGAMEFSIWDYPLD